MSEINIENFVERLVKDKKDRNSRLMKSKIDFKIIHCSTINELCDDKNQNATLVTYNHKKYLYWYQYW